MGRNIIKEEKKYFSWYLKQNKQDNNGQRESEKKIRIKIKIRLRKNVFFYAFASTAIRGTIGHKSVVARVIGASKGRVRRNLGYGTAWIANWINSRGSTNAACDTYNVPTASVIQQPPDYIVVYRTRSTQYKATADAIDILRWREISRGLSVIHDAPILSSLLG